MDKCTQTISDKCTQVLAGYVGTSNIVVSDKLSFSSSLKYSILNDPGISVDVESASEFSIYENQQGLIVPNSAIVAEARVADFLLGAARVRKQYEDLARMKDSGTSAAWLLVSTYYCAYFSCVEIGKLFNRISISFEKSDFQSLAAKSSGVHHKELFSAENLSSENLNFVGGDYAGKIKFRSIGARPHSAAWSNILYAMKAIFAKKVWPESERLIGLLANDQVSPSRIRNDWNYKRSDYFGSSGEVNGAEFKKLIGNNGAAVSWMARRYQSLSASDPCIVAFLCESLAPAVIDAAQKIRGVIRVKDS